MERDRKLQRIIRESGIVNAPVGFTGSVMERLGPASEQKRYRPLIGIAGRIGIISFILAVAVASFLLSEPVGSFMENTVDRVDLSGILSRWELRLEFMTKLDLSAGLVAGLAALFILVMLSEGIGRKWAA